MRRKFLSRALVIAAIAGLLFLVRVLPIGEWLAEAEAWSAAHPVAGALAYIAVVILAAIAMTPGWISMMLGGLLFGFFPGIAYALAGVTIGATVAMLAGRTLARRWVEKRIEGNERLQALDSALDEQAFVIVALTRVALVIPFNLLNYAYGLTRVDVRTYSLATGVGMLPVVGLYVYLGTLADDIGQILSGDAQPGTGAGWLAVVAVIAIAAVVYVVRRTVNRVLDEKTRAVTVAGARQTTE